MARLLAALLTGLAALAASTAARAVPLPEIVAPAVGPRCVLPAEQMRREHMELLRHQRARTVRQGIRGERFSLRLCIACHAGRDERGQPVSVAAPGQFCESCHRYAAVRIDCFQCHSGRPDPEAEAAARRIAGELAAGR
ncbi:sulfur reduction protein DsrJ [Inmirania thermothiophila]|uniref:Uncharacterized protein n=1 Tax=Inmirania thermothiophila TaxID=1750597 RepID=A0A3N1Y0W9_9GAMM|nr:sulfur reduction protein DsrJ [Inmirania thermothiophila]ROR32168.1 hypothetical protein EDC57_1359 [Inmirania thermothiophila]